MAAMTWANAASAAEPRLRCEVAESGETHQIETGLATDPYTVKAVDFRRFRFKAVLIGADRQIEYVKLYAYYLSGQRAVLLHESKHLPPFTQAALSGMNYLYSPELGRELQYQCFLSGLK